LKTKTCALTTVVSMANKKCTSQNKHKITSTALPEFNHPKKKNSHSNHYNESKQ